MRNLRFVLEDLDDRGRAVEPNRLSPGGEGFTGLEALLQYPFTQSQAINIFDSKGYILKLNILVNECTQYTNAETARSQPGADEALLVGARAQPARREHRDHAHEPRKDAPARRALRPAGAEARGPGCRARAGSRA